MPNDTDDALRQRLREKALGCSDVAIVSLLGGAGPWATKWVRLEDALEVAAALEDALVALRGIRRDAGQWVRSPDPQHAIATLGLRAENALMRATNSLKE